MATKFLIFLLLISAGCAGQIMQTNSTPGGYKFKALKADSMVVIPAGIDTPYMTNPKYGEASIGAVYYKTTDSTFWLRSATRWNKVSGGGGGSYVPGRFGPDTATMVMVKVHNDAGVILVNGDVVYLSTGGSNSDAPSVKKAINTGDATSANTFGFVNGSIPINDTGYIILAGKIEKLNTAAFSIGDVIYLDSIAGKFTKVKPQAPKHLVYLGAVVKSNAGNGAVYVKVQNGYELEELHNVQINAAANNEILVYSDTLKLWKNRPVSALVNGWNLTGNAGITPTSNFIGTTDSKSLRFRTNNEERILIDSALPRLSIGYNYGRRPYSAIHISDSTQYFSITTSYSGTNVLGTRLGHGVLETFQSGPSSGGNLLLRGHDGGAGPHTINLGYFTYYTGNCMNSGSAVTKHRFIGQTNAVANNEAVHVGIYPTLSSATGSTNTALKISPYFTSTGFKFLLDAGTNTAEDNAGTYTRRFLVDYAGRTAIGSGAIDSSAILSLNGTTGSLLLPRLTTTQTNALTPVAGMVHYNSDSSRLVAYNGTAWKGLAFTDAGGGGGGSTTSASGTGISLVNGASLVKRLKAGFNTIITDNTDSVTISRDTLTQTLTDGATITYSATAGVSARVTLGGNRTLSITNMNNGMYLTLLVVQDATGGRTLTLPAGTRVINGGAGAVTLSSAANAQDILTFFEINNVIYCNIGRNYN